jgi:hypothetical protein
MSESSDCLRLQYAASQDTSDRERDGESNATFEAWSMTVNCYSNHILPRVSF